MILCDIIINIQSVNFLMCRQVVFKGYTELKIYFWNPCTKLYLL